MATQIKTTQIKNFNEDIQDMLSSFLVQWSNITFAYDDVANTLTIASTGWGGGWSSFAETQVTVPSWIKNYWVREHSETISATGVVPTDIVQVMLATHLDTDENNEQWLNIISLHAVAGTDEITVNIEFGELTTWIIKLLYKLN